MVSSRGMPTMLTPTCTKRPGQTRRSNIPVDGTGSSIAPRQLKRRRHQSPRFKWKEMQYEVRWFVNRQAPWPPCQITFNRSPLRPRKQNNCPLSGSRRSISCTCSDRLARPFLMSVWPVASHTRTPLGTGIMAAFQAHARSAAASPHLAIDNNAPAVRHHNLDSTTARPFSGCSGTIIAGTNPALSPSPTLRWPNGFAPEASPVM
jgi:hypothetical protein